MILCKVVSKCDEDVTHKGNDVKEDNALQSNEHKTTECMYAKYLEHADNVKFFAQCPSIIRKIKFIVKSFISIT
jgi:hypothetical protein